MKKSGIAIARIAGFLAVVVMAGIARGRDRAR
jgi:hypothetical protein